MDDQTGNLKPDAVLPEAHPPGLAHNMGELGSDFLTLLELQARLGWEDLKTASRQATLGFAWTIVALGCAIGGLPVLLVGVAEFLVEVLGWTRWLAYLSFGTIAVLTSAFLAYLGARRIFANAAVFRRSRDELLKNLEWLKQVSRQTTASWSKARDS